MLISEGDLYQEVNLSQFNLIHQVLVYLNILMMKDSVGKAVLNLLLLQILEHGYPSKPSVGALAQTATVKYFQVLNKWIEVVPTQEANPASSPLAHHLNLPRDL